MRSRCETGSFPDCPAHPRSAAQDGGHAHHIKHSLSTPPCHPQEGGPHPPTCTNGVWSSHAPKRGAQPAPPGSWCLHTWVTCAPGLEGTIDTEVHTSLHTPNSPSILAGKGGGAGRLPFRGEGLAGPWTDCRGPPCVGRAQPSCPKHRPSFLYPRLPGGPNLLSQGHRPRRANTLLQVSRHLICGQRGSYFLKSGNPAGLASQAQEGPPSLVLPICRVGTILPLHFLWIRGFTRADTLR